MTPTAIKGWCPGVLRPMESGDGLIVRLKITGGIVPLELAAKIAAWCARWGNGEIDLTSRANLQLRGVTAQTLASLRDALASAGLRDADPDGEAVRNVIASPLAGLDPDALLDVRPLVEALEDRLVQDRPLHALPAKFGFLIDDGGRLSLRDVRADLRFQAVAGPAFDIWLDGNDEPICSCLPDQLVETAAALARVFLSNRRPDVRRMRDLVERAEALDIAAEAHLNFTDDREKMRLDRTPQRDVRLPAPLWGAGTVGTVAYLGVGLPFGRIASGELANLVNRALDNGATEFRLTPWRAILIPLPAGAAAKSLARQLAGTDLILGPADPRLHAAACTGAPGCAHGSTRTRADATKLAALVDANAGIALHVSGCAKGCAHPSAAPVTLVGRDGLYELVIDGAPSDPPSMRGLTLDAAAAHLRRIGQLRGQGAVA